MQLTPGLSASYLPSWVAFIHSPGLPSPEKVSNSPSDPQHDSLLDPPANPKTTKHTSQRSFVKHILLLLPFTSKIIREEAVSSRMQTYPYKILFKSQVDFPLWLSPVPMHGYELYLNLLTPHAHICVTPAPLRHTFTVHHRTVGQWSRGLHLPGVKSLSFSCQIPGTLSKMWLAFLCSSNTEIQTQGTVVNYKKTTSTSNFYTWLLLKI